MRSCQIHLFSDESIHLDVNDLLGYTSVLIDSLLIKKRIWVHLKQKKWIRYSEREK